MEGFIIAGSQRTGTSLVNSTLGNHPEIECFGELLLFSRGRGARIEGSYRQYVDKRPVIRSIAHRFRRQHLMDEYLDQTYMKNQTQVTGFKLMLDQVHNFPEVIRYVRRNQIKVLHLIRENILKTFVSRVSARTRKIYHVDESVSVEKVRIPTKGLLKRLSLVQQEITEWKDLAANNPYISISYESFVTNRSVELKKSFDFLGVKAIDTVSSKLRKINRDNLVDVVENFDQVSQILKGTKYEKFLS